MPQLPSGTDSCPPEHWGHTHTHTHTHKGSLKSLTCVLLSVPLRPRATVPPNAFVGPAPVQTSNPSVDFLKRIRSTMVLFSSVRRHSSGD